MLVDDGRLLFTDGRWTAAAGLDAGTVPPSIRAMLAARIDGLGAPERTVAERASVVGRVFEREAVNAITHGTLRSRLGSTLDALADKRLIRVDDATVTTYRFRHGLIRDAAYERIAKADRADLHERLADWLEATVGDRSGEHEEIIGYHLEQAFELSRALGTRSESSSLIADRAATWLGSAASRAERRYDVDVAVSLYRQGARAPAGIGSSAGDVQPAPRLHDGTSWPTRCGDRLPVGGDGLRPASRQRRSRGNRATC